MKKIVVITATFAAVACLDSAYAHHSSSLFDVAKAIWVKGTVVSYEPVNPHARLVIEETTGTGEIRKWNVEGPRLGRLEQLGVDENFLQPGEVINVCGFFPKQELAGKELYTDKDGLPAQFIHGRVLLLPNNQKWMWGPYGLLENCVSPDEWETILRGTNPLPAYPAR